MHDPQPAPTATANRAFLPPADVKAPTPVTAHSPAVPVPAPALTQATVSTPASTPTPHPHHLPPWLTLPRLALLALLALLTTLATLTLRPGAPSPSAQDRLHPAEDATPAHPAGTDALGRDRLVRTAAGTLLGFAGATSASLLTTALAASVGLLVAFGPRLLAGPLLLATDAFLALPWLFLLMMVRAGLPLSAPPLLTAAATFLLLGLLGWPACAQAVHAGALQLRLAPSTLHARASGLRTPQIMRAHLLPQLGPLLLPQFLISIPAFLIAEANLGTLGLGVGEPLPSWGSMLAELANSPVLFGSSPWVFLPFCVLLLSLVLLQLLLPEA